MIETLGNIGDFLGGIGVVVTLLYLARQIKQNSSSVETNAGHSILKSMSEALRTAAESRQLSGLIVKALSDRELDDDELPQFVMWIFSWLRIVEQAYDHYRLGNIPESQWEGQEAHLKSMMRTKVVQEFWNFRRSTFSREFQSYVDGLDLTSGAAVSPVAGWAAMKDASN
jgi:hypothetical protein